MRAPLILSLILPLMMTGCAVPQEPPLAIPQPHEAAALEPEARSVATDVPEPEPFEEAAILTAEPPRKIADIPLLIVGEGGTSGALFEYAAETFIREHGGVKVTVHDGDAFVAAMKKFTEEHGAISDFVYMGHGNEVGLYVNQIPGVNGSLYVNDPALNTKFRAASIYDLPPSTFAPGSIALFYGCNVARKKAGFDSFAEQFANHFRVTVTAPIGPTEFSFNPEGKSFLKHPAKVIPGPLYMVPTSDTKGFITIEPSPLGTAGYEDLPASATAGDAIIALRERGLQLDSTSSFLPYKSITYADAKAFCKSMNADAPCTADGYADDELFRNTAALKLLLDNAGYTMKRTNIPYQVQISFGTNNNLLTPDFTHRRWFSRSEMAMLTMNILKFKEGR